MQKKLTWILASAAAALFAFIFLVERKLPGTAERSLAPKLFPGLRAAEIRSIEITLAGGGRIKALLTNSAWTLSTPLYPAEQTIIENFATNLTLLRQLETIPQHEVALEGAKSFGLDPPAAIVEVGTEASRTRFQVGKLAPLTNNAYLRLEPSGAVVLTDGLAAAALPKTTNDWRSPMLVHLPAAGFDQVEMRQGTRLFGLGKHARSGAWQIVRPVPARADQDRVAALLDKIRAARVGQFIADGPANLPRYGLQFPELELSLFRGANEVFKAEFGNAPSAESTQVYARLNGVNVVLVERGFAELLKQRYQSFHDPQLVRIDPQSLDRILVKSVEEFTLQRQPDGRWGAGEKGSVPVDDSLLAGFIGAVSAMQIIDIAKEAPSDAEITAFGFAKPAASYSFFERRTNSAGMMTNILFTDITFGNNQQDRIFVRRSDESPIYVTPLAQMFTLPRREFELRERKIWDFNSKEVFRVTLRNAAGTNIMERAGPVWSDDHFVHEAVEEALFRLGKLQAGAWVAKGAERKGSFAISEGSLVFELVFRNARGLQESIEIQFGRATLRRDVYAAIVPAGESEALIFEFPGELHQLILESFPIPR